MKKIVLLALAIASTAGMVQCPSFNGSLFDDEYRDPTLTMECSDFAVTLHPNSCRRIANPCTSQTPDGDIVAEEWLPPSDPRADGFALESVPGSIFVRKFASLEDATGWSICSAGDALVKGVDTKYKYGREDFENGSAWGIGHVFITVKPPFIVEVSAAPQSVPLGGSSQLLAIASGGIPPYSYSWRAPDPRTQHLSAVDIPDPVATPPSTETFVVDVKDAWGESVVVNVTVHVELAGLNVGVYPREITPGGNAYLSAVPTLGTSPFTYVWSPPEGLDDPTSRSPLASPQATTTYGVSVTDAVGATQTGSVEVFVAPQLLVQATAFPAAILVGQTSHLDAIATGGDGVYSYAWSPATGISHPAIRNPIASPNSSATYTVTVTDGHGISAEDLVLVTVKPTGPLAASFTFLRGALDPVARTIHWTFDASASTGNIASYTWDLHGNDGTSVHTVTTGPALELDLVETAQRGSMTLTVTAADSTTAALTLNYR